MEGTTLNLDQEDRAARQRDFYTKLLPHGGHVLATMRGGMLPASKDVVDEEARDAVELWYKCSASGMSEVLIDNAWWMTKLMDEGERMGMIEYNKRASELVSFSVACIGQLIDRGILAWAKEPTIPEIKTSAKPLSQTDAAEFQRLVARLKESNKQ
jgi:hypothetical protein